MKKLKNLALKKISWDAQKLIERNPSAFELAVYADAIPEADYMAGYKIIRRSGYVPENSRAIYLLINEYERKKKESAIREDRIEFVALKAAAECKWEMDLTDLKNSIRLKKNGTEIVEVLFDWSIAVLKPVIS